MVVVVVVVAVEQENSKKLTDYREESTFSFDPGKLPLVLLEKGHHQSKSRSMRARKHRAQAGRNQSQSDHSTNADFHQDHQGPLWALAQSEILKLRTKKSSEMEKQENNVLGCDASNADNAIHGTIAHDHPPTDDNGINPCQDHEAPEMGFTLQITESRSQCGTDNKVTNPIPRIIINDSINDSIMLIWSYGFFIKCMFIKCTINNIIQ